MAQELATVVGERQSSHRAAAPRLSPRMLTSMLIAMTLIPPTMIFVLWSILPPVKANQLRATVHIENAPPPNYYVGRVDDRPFDPNVSVVVTNTGDVPWTHINVRVNRYFHIYDSERPLNSGESRSYLLNRFLSRGVLFDMRHSPVQQVLVYARLPDGSRATYWQSMEE